MGNLYDDNGRVDRAAVMRKAHAMFRDMRRRGAEEFTFGRCLRMVAREARGKRDAAGDRGEFVRQSLIEKLGPEEASVARVVGRYLDV